MVKDKIKLLTVEDAFFIEGRGVLVLPMITDYSGPTSFSVVLRKPNGDETLAQANLDVPRLKHRGDPHPFACALAGLSKEDVPIGTEIWISYEPAA
jgi:hypothetical protein